MYLVLFHVCGAPMHTCVLHLVISSLSRVDAVITPAEQTLRLEEGFFLPHTVI